MMEDIYASPDITIKSVEDNKDQNDTIELAQKRQISKRRKSRNYCY